MRVGRSQSQGRGTARGTQAHKLRRRDARIAELERRATLTRGEYAELRRLTEARDHMWRRLPDRIAHHRAALRALETYAEDIGLGPC